MLLQTSCRIKVFPSSSGGSGGLTHRDQSRAHLARSLRRKWRRGQNFWSVSKSAKRRRRRRQQLTSETGLLQFLRTLSLSQAVVLAAVVAVIAGVVTLDLCCWRYCCCWWCCQYRCFITVIIVQFWWNFWFWFHLKS